MCRGAKGRAGPLPGGSWHCHMAQPHFPSSGTGELDLASRICKNPSSSSLWSMLGQRGESSVPLTQHQAGFLHFQEQCNPNSSLQPCLISPGPRMAASNTSLASCVAKMSEAPLLEPQMLCWVLQKQSSKSRRCPKFK